VRKDAGTSATHLISGELLTYARTPLHFPAGALPATSILHSLLADRSTSRSIGSLVTSRVVSGVTLALGVALFVPLTLSLLYRDGSWASFLLPDVAMASIGAVGLQMTTSLLRTPR
jgi:hypothetical protein